jgi:hypothetical protein
MRFVISTNAQAVAGVLQIEVAGLRDWSKKGSKGEPSCWDRYGEVWRASRRRMYASQNASEGTRWVQYLDTPERDHYIWAKSAIAGIPVTQIESTVLLWPPYNRLFGSLTAVGHPDAVANVAKESAEFGTRTPWGYANHTGTGRAPRYLGGHETPKRPLLDIGQQTIEDLTDEAVDYVSTRLSDATERVTAKTALAMRRAT